MQVYEISTTEEARMGNRPMIGFVLATSPQRYPRLRSTQLLTSGRSHHAKARPSSP